MASKASKGTFLTPLPKTPQTYKDIKTLNLKELKALCKDANIPTEGIGRDALEILFALEVGISTSGSKKDEANQNNADSGTLQKSLLDPRQLKEFYSLTPTNVIKQPGWKKDISGLPDLDVSVVKSYLKNSKKEEFSAESLKRYKTTRAYEHIEANHICNMAFNGLAKSNTFCVVRASCLPSQSGDDVKIKYLHVILDKWTGEPYGGFCTCTVGLGQACSHIGALLFLLAEHVATGKNLPDDVSVTEIPAAWKDPKLNPSEVKRDIADIKKKWQDVQSITKKKEAARVKAVKATGGGPPPEDSSSSWEKVIIGTFTKTMIEGIEGGIDTSASHVTPSSSSNLTSSCSTSCSRTYVTLDDLYSRPSEEISIETVCETAEPSHECLQEPGITATQDGNGFKENNKRKKKDVSCDNEVDRFFSLEVKKMEELEKYRDKKLKLMHSMVEEQKKSTKALEEIRDLLKGEPRHTSFSVSPIIKFSEC